MGLGAKQGQRRTERRGFFEQKVTKLTKGALGADGPQATAGEMSGSEGVNVTNRLRVRSGDQLIPEA